MTKAPVAILGIFVADLAFKAPRLPVMGETILGQGFKDGPGGKGSNQAIAAARAGADVRMITRIGRDTFGAMARGAWAADGIDVSAVIEDAVSRLSGAFHQIQVAVRERAAGDEDDAHQRGRPANHGARAV